MDDVKIIINAIVVAEARTMTLQDLEREYKDMEGSFLPWKKLGFQDALALLRAIPDTVRVTSRGGTVLIDPVITGTTRHIHALIKGQRKDAKKNVCPIKMHPMVEQNILHIMARHGGKIPMSSLASHYQRFVGSRLPSPKGRQCAWLATSSKFVVTTDPRGSKVLEAIPGVVVSRHMMVPPLTRFQPVQAINGWPRPQHLNSHHNRPEPSKLPSKVLSMPPNQTPANIFSRPSAPQTLPLPKPRLLQAPPIVGPSPSVKEPGVTPSEAVRTNIISLLKNTPSGAFIHLDTLTDSYNVFYKPRLSEMQTRSYVLAMDECQVVKMSTGRYQVKLWDGFRNTLESNVAKPKVKEGTSNVVPRNGISSSIPPSLGKTETLSSSPTSQSGAPGVKSHCEWKTLAQINGGSSAAAAGSTKQNGLSHLLASHSTTAVFSSSTPNSGVASSEVHIDTAPPNCQTTTPFSAIVSDLNASFKQRSLEAKLSSRTQPTVTPPVKQGKAVSLPKNSPTSSRDERTPAPFSPVPRRNSPPKVTLNNGLGPHGSVKSSSRTSSLPKAKSVKGLCRLTTPSLLDRFKTPQRTLTNLMLLMKKNSSIALSKLRQVYLENYSTNLDTGMGGMESLLKEFQSTGYCTVQTDEYGVQYLSAAVMGTDEGEGLLTLVPTSETFVDCTENYEVWLSYKLSGKFDVGNARIKAVVTQTSGDGGYYVLPSSEIQKRILKPLQLTDRAALRKKPIVVGELYLASRSDLRERVKVLAAIVSGYYRVLLVDKGELNVFKDSDLYDLEEKLTKTPPMALGILPVGKRPEKGEEVTIKILSQIGDRLISALNEEEFCSTYSFIMNGKEKRMRVIRWMAECSIPLCDTKACFGLDSSQWEAEATTVTEHLTSLLQKEGLGEEKFVPLLQVVELLRKSKTAPQLLKELTLL